MLEHALEWSRERQSDRLLNATNKYGDGYIYLIKCGRFYKIGISKNPTLRVVALQTGAPLKMRVVASWYSINPVFEESEIHQLLSEYRMNREWFRLPKFFVQALLKKWNP